MMLELNGDTHREENELLRAVQNVLVNSTHFRNVVRIDPENVSIVAKDSELDTDAKKPNVRIEINCLAHLEYADDVRAIVNVNVYHENQFDAEALSTPIQSIIDLSYIHKYLFVLESVSGFFEGEGYIQNHRYRAVKQK